MFGIKKPASAKDLRDMLPSLHSFVDVAVKNGPKGSVCFEAAGSKSFTTSALTGMSAGQTASFLYSNALGRYRFSATITAVDAKQATFALPARVDTVQRFSGAHRRNTVRVDTTVAMQWRYAPAGRLETEYHKGVVSDISRTGCSLTTERPMKIGNVLELKVPILPGGANVILRAETMRIDAIASLKKHSIGLKFTHLTPEGDRAVFDFINRRQTELRGRGLG